MVKKNISIVIVFVFAILGGFSLLRPGLHPTHDGEYHVIRFYEFDKVLRDGDWYPRWAPDLNSGYGVPLFNYVYPFPNYMAFFLHLFGISFIDAFKLSMFVATIVGALFFYLWSRIYWGSVGGTVSAIFYTFSPYRFVDMYIRGSVGEVWALSFFPAFLWAIAKFTKERKRIFLLLSSIFLALIIFSHNILALMFFIFSPFYIIVLIWQQKNRKFLILNSLFIVLLGLGLSAVFWLPALLETGYARGLQVYQFVDRYPELYQLLFPSWGSGFMNNNLADQMSYQIGIANIVAVLLSGYLVFMQKKKLEEHRGVVMYFFICFVVVFFLMLKVSFPVWKIIPLMSYFQFPWRFLSLEILFASFFAGAVAFSFRSKVLACFLVLLVVLLGISYTKPAYYHNRDDAYYISRSNFIDGTNSPGNTFNTLWMNSALKRQSEKAIFREKEGKVSMLLNKQGLQSRGLYKSTRYTFQVDVQKGSTMVINTAFFPGWSVFIDGVRSKINRNDDGLITFFVPPGPHNIEVKFQDTPIRTFAVVLSLVSLLCAVIVFLKWRNA